MKKKFNFNPLPYSRRKMPRPGDVFFDEEMGMWGFNLMTQKTTLDRQGYMNYVQWGQNIYTPEKVDFGPGITDLGGDIFTHFYFPNVKPLEGEDIPEERRLSSMILNWFRQETLYQGLQNEFYEDPYAASIAASAAWNHLIKDDTIQKILNLQDQLEKLLQKMREAGMNPDGEGEGGEGEEGEEDGANDPDGGKMRKQLKEMRAKIGQVMQKAQAPGTEEVLKQKAAAAAKAGKEAGESHKELTEAMAWGNETGEGGPQNTRAIMDFAKRHARWIKAFAKIIGRARKVALNAAKRHAKTNQPIATGGYTPNLLDLTPDSLTALAHPHEVISTLAAVDFLDRGALGYLKKADAVEEGHFAMAVDVSGSMGDEEFLIATGVAIGVARAARESNRKYYMCKFDSSITAEVRSEENGQKHLNWCAARSGGGTNFDYPLSKMADEIEKAIANASGETSGMDAVIVSDGYAPLSDKTRNRWIELRKQGVRLLYVAVGDGTGVLNELATATLELHKLDMEQGEVIADAIGKLLAPK